MFKTMMKYRVLTQIRSKESIFWVLLFPIILSILFYVALSDINKGETFETIHIAVVKDTNYENNMVMSKIIDAVSKKEDNSEEKPLFSTEYVTKNDAEKMLNNNKIAAYVELEDGCNVVIKDNGMEQTIIKKFFDIAVQKEAIINNIIEINKTISSEEIEEIMSDTNEYIVEVANRENKPDTALQFFYSILGMTCMYGATTGCTAIKYIQANQSAIAKRNTVAPVGKMKLLLSSFIVDAIMNSAIVLIVIAFIKFVLGVNFGERYALIVFTSVIGSITGLSFGYFFASLTKKSLAFKNNIVIAISMICSFLAGMMTNEIKYIVKQNAYIIDRINPVNLITESYYKLYYYTNLDKYYENIIILVVMTIVFVLGTVFMLNHQEKNIIKERSNKYVL